MFVLLFSACGGNGCTLDEVSHRPNLFDAAEHVEPVEDGAMPVRSFFVVRRFDVMKLQLINLKLV